jgi:hypothetical protein
MTGLLGCDRTPNVRGWLEPLTFRSSLSKIAGMQVDLEARRRRLANGFIALFLGLQVAVPLSYYLGDRSDDERFSWRMFSSVRLRDCRVQVNEFTERDAQPRPVAIERDVHVAWLRLLERMRGAVVDKYLQRRCEREAIQRVELVRSCRDTEGRALPPLTRSLECPPRAEARL